MPNLIDIMNFLTKLTLDSMLFLCWAFALVTIIKWFIQRAKVSLYYLFPTVKWFKLEEGESNDKL